MNPTIKKQLIEWAGFYESKSFILNDPIQFPHRFDQPRDIEIAGKMPPLNTS